MQIASIGIDLGKTTFHLVALDEHSKVIFKKKFSRQQLLAYTANLPSSLVGMEPCSGAHFLGAALRNQGHNVRLIPAQFVKPFLKSNKNDYLDAEAIAEAVARQNMRFVPIKTNDQLDLQALGCGLPAFTTDPRSGPPVCHRHGRGHRQWRGVPQRPGVCRLAGVDPATTLDRRQGATARHQQTWECLSAPPVHHGARAMLLRVKYDTGRLGQWAHQLELRAPRNKVVVAVANKLARIAWAVLASGNEYRNFAVAAA